MSTLTTLSPAARGADFPGTIQPWRSLASLGIDPVPLETGPESLLGSGHTADPNRAATGDRTVGDSSAGEVRMPGLIPFPPTVFSPVLAGDPGHQEA